MNVTSKQESSYGNGSAQADTVEFSDNWKALAALCKASADEFRLQILRALNRESFGVLELCNIFSIKQSGMSHHLKVLANAGLVSTRREGNSIFYSRSHQAGIASLNPHQQSLFCSVDQLNLPQKHEQNLDEVRRDRLLSSQRFFASNADKFRQQQDLIASYEQYAESVVRLLDSVAQDQHSQALEIGPGDGVFLQELATRFKCVLAIDNSAEMLDKAKQFVQEKNLSNVELQLSDTSTAVQNKLSADVIVLNMVLHHTSSPADIFQDLSQLLNDNGSIIICDLGRHDQNWARTSCGDQWLGFEPEDLSSWAGATGLMAGEEMYLSLRNGFQIQIRHFFKSQKKD